MKKTGLFATVGATSVAVISSAFADESKLVENLEYAEAIANSIVEECQNLETQQGRIDCVAQGVTASYTIATDMGTYLDEVTAKTNALGAGIAKGNLIAFCYSPVESFSGSTFSNFNNYIDAAHEVVKSCEVSMIESGEEVGINYEPTARNTVSCHLNRLIGYDCDY